MRDLAGHRFDWEQALRDLSRAIPADVTLSELTGNVLDRRGRRRQLGLRGAIAAPAITLKGCTDTQHDVARLMARLRNVDGVTRVSLAKSEKADSDQPSGAGSPPITGAPAAIADRRATPLRRGQPARSSRWSCSSRASADATHGRRRRRCPPPAPRPRPRPPAPARPAPTPPPATHDPGRRSAQTATPTTQGGVSP